MARRSRCRRVLARMQPPWSGGTSGQALNRSDRTVMDDKELDALDQAIARIEGFPLAICSCSGNAIRPDRSPYTPTRDADETLRLLAKYVTKLIRMNDGVWAAVGPNGRACVGSTVSVAICRAIVEARL